MKRKLSTPTHVVTLKIEISSRPIRVAIIQEKRNKNSIPIDDAFDLIRKLAEESPIHITTNYPQVIAPYSELAALLDEEFEITMDDGLLKRIEISNFNLISPRYRRKYFIELTDNLNDTAKVSQLLGTLLYQLKTPSGDSPYKDIVIEETRDIEHRGRYYSVRGTNPELKLAIKSGKPKNQNDLVINDMLYLDVADDELGLPDFLFAHGRNRWIMNHRQTNDKVASYGKFINANSEEEARKAALREFNLCDGDKELIDCRPHLVSEGHYDVNITMDYDFLAGRIITKDGVSEFVWR